MPTFKTTWFAMSALMPPAADRFPGKQPPRKKRMTEKDIEERRKLYEEEKRERVFDPEGTWVVRWPWVAFDDEKSLVYCKVCREYKDAADR